MIVGMASEVLIAFDFETTGLDPEKGDEIVEVGAIPIIDGVVREDCAFHALVDPDRAIPPDSASVHGITDDMVRGKPRIDVVMPEFLRYCGMHDLVAQNAEFDMAFIQAYCRRLELEKPQGRLTCTMLLSRQLHPGERRHSLDDICRRLRIDVAVRHRSLDDVLLTAKAFLVLRERLATRRTSTTAATTASAATTTAATPTPQPAGTT
jgi:DNA polymerase III subunit epsilon